MLTPEYKPNGGVIVDMRLVTNCCLSLAPPMAPRWLVVLSISRNSAEMKWTAPERDGGSPITNYVVEKRDVREEGLASSGHHGEGAQVFGNTPQ